MKRINEEQYDKLCVGARDSWIEDDVHYRGLPDCKCKEYKEALEFYAQEESVVLFKGVPCVFQPSLDNGERAREVLNVS